MLLEFFFNQTDKILIKLCILGITDDFNVLVHAGHDHLLELRLLEKSARHGFIITRHRSCNNIFSCQLLESS